ncbi:MAG: NAD-dependent epimerase/dehydratase family protein [Elusimicrobia bacterium]|nr:NAD-dependent epimerase/dehydratase family protein [Elusimicrobiota bacterium]
MKRVVLTGGTGFVGANLARRLLRDGHEVHLFVRRGHAGWRLEGIRGDVVLHELSLSDEAAMVRVLRRVRPDWIFHLAAHGAYSSQRDVQRMVETNVLGTMRLLDAAARGGFEAFVHAGSSSEYGVKDHAPSEDEALEPNCPYGVTKAAATLYGRQVARRLGLKVHTLRLYAVYGPYEEPSRFVPTLITKGLAGRLPDLVHPWVGRDFIHVEDAVDAFVRAAAARLAPGSVFNIGTGVQTTIRRAVQVARRAMELRARPCWGSMPDRCWDTSVWVADIGNARRRLRWRPATSFEEGFRATLNWLRARPSLRAYYRLHQDRLP